MVIKWGDYSESPGTDMSSEECVAAATGAESLE